MPLNTTDQIRLNSAGGHLQLGDALDAWHEIEMIAPQARAQTEVLVVRLDVCRALKIWEAAEEVSRTLNKREPARKTLDRNQSQQIVPSGLWSDHDNLTLSFCGFLPNLSFDLGLVCARLKQQYSLGGDQGPRGSNKPAADQILARNFLARSCGKGPEHGGLL